MNDLKKPSVDTQTIKSIVKNVKGVGKVGLTKYIAATSSLPREFPPLIDHTKADDSYVSLFGGKDQEKRASSASVSRYCSI